MAKPITIGDVRYPTQAELVATIKGMLAKGETLRLTGHEAELAEYLWERHTNRAMKTLSGRFFGYRIKKGQLHVVWESGECDFSYRKCLGGKVTVPDAAIAAREAVAGDMGLIKQLFMQEHGGCECCGGKLGLNVHHGEPWLFRDILRAFIEATGQPEIATVPTAAAGQSQHVFVDPSVRDQWVEFHNKTMIPQLFCAPCHREAHREGGR
jgi:hypothetical protein